MKLTLNYSFRVGYTLSPGQGGIWSITKDSSRTTFPGASATPNVVDCTNNSEGDTPWAGNIERERFDLYLRKFDKAKSEDLPNWLEDIAKEWYGNQNLGIQKAVDGVMESLRDVVIMPAGTVLTFKGLDCDHEGNVYSSVDWQTLTPSR